HCESHETYGNDWAAQSERRAGRTHSHWCNLKGAERRIDLRSSRCRFRSLHRLCGPVKDFVRKVQGHALCPTTYFATLTAAPTCGIQSVTPLPSPTCWPY